MENMNVVAGAVSIIALFMIPVGLSLQKKKKRRGKLKRSWSFTADGMRSGIFPDTIEAPPTVINAAVYFKNDNVPTVEDLLEQVVKPLLKYDRFSMIPTEGGLRDPEVEYDPKDFIRTIPITGEEVALRDTITKTLSDNLHVGRGELPWWEIVVIRSGNKGSRSVCLLRFHHVIGDGLSLVNVFDKIIQPMDGSTSESKVTQALMKRVVKFPSISSILSSTLHVLTLGASAFDDTTPFNPRPKTPEGLKYSHERQLTFLPEVSLSYIKELKSKTPFQTTVNDIIMCVVSQIIYEYNKSKQEGEDIKKDSNNLQCRALLPVSLPRKLKEGNELTNQFAMVSANMSAGHYTSVTERLKAIKSTTDALKSAPTAFIQVWVQNNILTHLPLFVGRQTANDIFGRHSLVLTNVPGPEKPSRLAGKEFVELQLVFLNVIPQVDILTYAGTVYANMVYDGINELKDGNTLFPKLYAKALVELGEEFGVPPPKDLVAIATK